MRRGRVPDSLVSRIRLDRVHRQDKVLEVTNLPRQHFDGVIEQNGILRCDNTPFVHPVPLHFHASDPSCFRQVTWLSR